MVFDKQNMFSDDQAITADARSSNVLDLGVARNLAPGEPVHLRVQVTEVFNNLTSLDVEIHQDDNAAFTSAEVLAESNLLAADLVAGAVFRISFVPRNDERYLSLYYDVNGSAPSTGKITAGIVLDEQDNVL